MKIGFFGDGPWAERALLPLAQDSRYTIVFVAVRASRPDQKLIEMARGRDIPVLCPASVNSDESLAEIGSVRRRSARLDVVRPDSSRKDSGPAAARHAELPRRRLAVLSRTQSADLGDHQRRRGIRRHRALGRSRNRHRRYRAAGQDADKGRATPTPRCWHPQRNSAPPRWSGQFRTSTKDTDRRIVQATIDPVGMYCCRRREGDEEIDWTSGTASIERFVRALVPPGPGARTTWKDASYAILAAETIDGAKPYAGAAGEVIGRD